MGEKSEQKKKFILETAKKVFIDKGYKDVTMKDIVDACEISRGGLYLYFSSTEELFSEVMHMETQEADDVFSNKISEDATATEILFLFLKEQKKEIFSKKNLTIAIYEYFFLHKPTRKNNILRKQFEAAILILENLIEDGIESGELYCDDAHGTASNIMFVLEGLKISSQTMRITEAMVDKELLYIMQGLVVED